MLKANRSGGVPCPCIHTIDRNRTYQTTQGDQLPSGDRLFYARRQPLAQTKVERPNILRLHEVPDEACFLRPTHILISAETRDGECRDILCSERLPRLPQELIPAHSRQPDIREDHVRLLLTKLRQRILTIGDRPH